MQRTAHSALSITPAFRRRFAYGLVFLAGLAGLCGLFFALLSVASSRGRPQAPALELNLELAKTRLRQDEYLWYRLEIANVGKTIVPIYDRFWVHQHSQEKNWEKEKGTYLQITDEHGKDVSLGNQPWFYLWEDDLSNYTPPEQQGIRGVLYRLHGRGIIPSTIFWPIFQNFMEKWDKDLAELHVAPVLLLRPGERFAATPAVAKEINPSSRNPRQREGDPRLIPYAPRGWSRDQVEQLKRTWKQEMENLFLWGGPQFKRNPHDFPPPSGFRVLERWHPKPGRYRIKVIYDTRAELPSLSADEEIEKGRKSHDPLDYKGASWGDFFEITTRNKWKLITPADFEKIREQRRNIEAKNKAEVYVESNTVNIEVVR